MQAAVSPERWAQIKTLFAEAAELPREARADWLTDACRGDEALRAEVEKLLAADEQAEAFLESAPIKQLQAETLPAPLTEGASLGAYRIVRELGRGGMGTVYLAERAAAGFEQLVAIKVIKRGMDSDEVLRRFYAERQILAQLNHPNIARLLDGGQTADGRPYYVMEYIAGVALDEFCKTQSLPLPERLRLFQDVCAAVAYAHQHLVIHRDLKPSNILVTAEGVVKLLDFGIAKVLSSDDPAETVTQMQMLTPAYASPEQLRGQRLTTASDIYSLGVVLYELLTGVSPYNVAATDAHAFTLSVCETEPLRPSLRVRRTDAAQRISTELDAIVMMALRKEAGRRYVSVEQFSEDLRRYQTGLPVSARPDTLGYRLNKFVVRNRALSVAALALVLSLTGGIALTWRQARIAERERQLAEKRFDDVRQLANAFVFKYDEQLARLQGATPLREMMISDAKNYLTRLAQDAGGDVGLQLELAQAWMKVGDVLGRPYVPNLGQTDEALKSYHQARQLAEAVLAQAPQQPVARRVLGLTLQNIGSVETRAGQASAAIPRLEKAIQLLQQDAKPDGEMRAALARAHLTLADCLMRNGATASNSERAIASFRQSLQLSEALARDFPEETRYLRLVAIIEQRLGLTLPQADKTALPEAVAHHQRSTQIFARLLARNQSDAKAQRDLFDQYQMKAEVQARAGDLANALADCRKAITYFEKAAALDPQNAEASRDLATAHYIASTVQAIGRNTAAAAAEIRQALAIYEKLAARDPRNAENYQDMLSGYGRLADAETALGHQAQAQAAIKRKQEYQAKLNVLR